MIKWLKDPEGNEYRYVYSKKLGRTVVEYRPAQPRRSGVPFRAFVVRFWGEVGYVGALSAEAAGRVFASKFLLTSPRSEEITVEEMQCR